MEVGVRRAALPLNHPRRIKERDEKLIQRELERAGNSRSIPCPCRLCKRSIKCNRSGRAVKDHIRLYGFHEWLRGSTEVITSFCLDVNVFCCFGIV